MGGETKTSVMAEVPLSVSNMYLTLRTNGLIHKDADVNGTIVAVLGTTYTDGCIVLVG